ncbi:MAG TPA: hypothetical protein VKB29_04935 [Candidatus Binataceae bacterium]|nr:hypothetical protein [Candidatus Binataceae bacterium]
MWRKTLLIVQLSLFALAAFAGQACFEEHYSSPYRAPEYYSAGPPEVVGDYDDHHVWHNREWWVGHDRDWVSSSSHHHEWLEHHDEHEHRGG